MAKTMSDTEDRELIETFLERAGFDYSVEDQEGVLGFDLVVTVYGRAVSRPDPYAERGAFDANGGERQHLNDRCPKGGCGRCEW